jgi:hypothetical protein
LWATHLCIDKIVCPVEVWSIEQNIIAQTGIRDEQTIQSQHRGQNRFRRHNHFFTKFGPGTAGYHNAAQRRETYFAVPFELFAQAGFV